MKIETLQEKMMRILIKYFRGKSFTARQACAICSQIYSDLDRRSAEKRARGILGHLYSRGQIVLVSVRDKEHTYRLGV